MKQVATHVMNHFWPAVILLGIGTLVLRAGFIVVMGQRMPSETMRRLLAYIPSAVLPALIVPAIVYGEQSYVIDGQKIAAGLIAGVVAWRTRSAIATIATGLALLGAMRAWM